MKGWAGLIGTFLPFFVLFFAAWGPLRGRSLWRLSLVSSLLSMACFFLLTATFFAKPGAFGGFVFSPLALEESPWSKDTALRWIFSTSLLALAASAVVVCFHFLARETIEKSRATVAGLAGYLGCILGLLGADNLLLYSIFFSGTLVPRFVFMGMESLERRIEAIKETAFLSIIALFSLLICVLVFSDSFRPGLASWFRVSGATHEALPGSIGFCLLLLAASIGAGIFPFHGNSRKFFEMDAIERAIPLALQPVVGFILLFRFGSPLFTPELKAFGDYLLGFFSVSAAYCAVNFVGSRAARDRVFWLQQTISSFVAVGFFSLSAKGWHGATVLLFFETLAIPFLLILLACHARRAALLPIQRIREFPAFALASVAAVLSALFLPVSIGFYGVLLVIWSLVGQHDWPLPFVISAIPLVALGGMNIMFFSLSADPMRGSSTGDFFELSRDEKIAIAPLGLTLLLLGIVPKFILGPLGVAVGAMLTGLGLKS
jgi:NADH:ubiquinone oxidoreductase subunit 4 (subunit M)